MYKREDVRKDLVVLNLIRKVDAILKAPLLCTRGYACWVGLARSFLLLDVVGCGRPFWMADFVGEAAATA